MDLIPKIFKKKKLVKIIINLVAITIGLVILISSKLFIGW